MIEATLYYLMGRAGVELDCCMKAMGYLKTEEQQKEMLSFLQKNPTATNRQVMFKTKEIIEK
jgi:hypothetical protein